MIGITYDSKADAAYFRIGEGKVVESEEASPFIYDVATKRRIIGIGSLTASRTLAPCPWRNAHRPGKGRKNAAR